MYLLIQWKIFPCSNFKTHRRGTRNESSSLLFYFGFITESTESSYIRLETEKNSIVLNILQLHRMSKQQDEDPMEKGAWDGKACGAIAFALNFSLVTFFGSRQKKWQIYNWNKQLRAPWKVIYLFLIFKLLAIGITTRQRAPSQSIL